MGGLLRKLLIYICKPIYKLIVYVYKIFYNLANTHILNQDIVQQLSSNIYVLISVVMLFAFSVTILSAIVNPDLLNDKKKGVTAIFKRSIIGLALMVIVPFGFNELYKIQESIMTNSVIEKLVIGVDFSCKETDSDCEIGGNGGQVIAGTLISSVLYPVDDEVKIAANVSESYSMMVAEDISYIGDVAKNINVTREGDTDESFHLKFDDEDYAFNFDGLLAILVGGATLYILVLFALDIAVRIFKLAFLELTAPISIVGYIAAGDKILSSWFKQLFKTYMDLFIRIAAMAFYLFLISNLSNFTKEFGENDWTFVFKAFLIVGMLIFAKQVPNLIGDVLGIKIETKGGIGGRLGEMAVVGKQAQKAWDATKKVAGLGATGVGLAAASLTPAGLAAIGATAVGATAWNKGKNTAFVRGLTNTGKTIGSFMKASNPISGIHSAYKTATENSDSAKSRDWERKQVHSDEIKKKATENAHDVANQYVPNLYDSNGDIDKNVAISANTDSIVDGSKLSSNEKTITKDYINAQRAKMAAEDDKKHYDSVSRKISDAISSSSNDTEKQALLGLKQAIDSGKSATISTSGMNSTLASLVNDISSEASLINGKSKDDIDDNLKQTTEKFGKIESKFNDMVDNSGEQRKADLKSYSKIGEEVNKVQTHRSYTSSSPTTNYASSSNTAAQTNNNYDQSLNLDLNKTSPEPIKSGDYNISSNGELHLNQQQVEEQKLDSERAKLDDDLDRMTNDINKMSSNGDKQKFKLKDE